LFTYLGGIGQCKTTADPQRAHLVFAETQPNAEKPKEPFFANATTKNRTEKSNLDE